MKLRDLLACAIVRLKAAGIVNASRDSRAIVAHATNIPPSRITLCGDEIITAGQCELTNTLLIRRASGCPVSRLIGKRLFWGREFLIDQHVLDPRGDTETLVELALKTPAYSLLDLGTGSGAIAVTLSAEWPKAKVIASDVSREALLVAMKNARRHGVVDRCDFLHSDWYVAVEGIFDLIVSNPPYIGLAELSTLSREVKNFDPLIALCPGSDGLSAYRKIISGGLKFLIKEGRLIVEIGSRQGKAVAEIMHSAGYKNIETHKDFDKNDRVVSGVAP